MSGITIIEDEAELSRAEVAGELRRLAGELEAGGELRYGRAATAGTVTVPERVRREFEIKRRGDARFTLEIELHRTSAEPTAPGVAPTRSGLDLPGSAPR